MSKPTMKLTGRLFLILSSFLLVVLLVHFAGVALLRYYTEDLLHPALPRGTQIGEVDLNLFTGTLRIKDFELREKGQTRMRLGRLELKMSPWRLLIGEAYVRRAWLADGFVRVERHEDGSYDLGVPPFGDQAPVREEAEPAAFVLAGAGLEGFTVEYHDGEFTSVARLHKVELGAFSARTKTQRVPLSWHLSLDERDIRGEASLILDQEQFAATGRLTTEVLNLQNLQRLAALDPVVRGEAAIQGDFSWQMARLTLSGALQAPQLTYQVSDRQVTVDGLESPDFEFRLTTAPALIAELSPRKGSRVDKLEWKTPEQLVTAGGVRITGEFRYEDNKLVNAGGLEFDAGSLDWQAGTQRAKLSDFACSGTLQQGIAGELRLPSADLQLRSARVEFEDTSGALAVALDGFGLQGLKLRPVEGAEDGASTIEGQLSVASSRVGQSDTVLHWSELTAAIGGRVGLADASISSDLHLAALELENPALVNGPLQIRKITARGLLLGTESRFDHLQLDGIGLPGELPETGLEVATLTFGNGSFAPNEGLDLGDIVIDGLQTAVIRDKSGQWRHPGTAVKLPEPENDTGEQGTETDEPALAWRIGSLRVAGESYLTSGDRTNPAATPLRNRIDVLTIGELASSRPDQDTPFEMAIDPDKYTRFEIKGLARPIADPVYLDARGELQGLAMSRLNGYIANDLGHQFTEGQLDTRFDVKIANNQLKMGNFLELHGAEAEALEGKEGPPLATAIALLEDRDGYVKLEVPVEGQLDDPNFRVLAALNPIIMKAVAGTAALAIQPLGSVLLVGGLVADQALKVSFNPVVFEAGSTQLDPKAQKYLGELAGKLQEKPKLALRICGVVADVERQRDKKGAYLDNKEALLEIAQQRAQTVRSFMDGEGAGKKQLRSCRPQLDEKPEAKPRVDIRL